MKKTKKIIYFVLSLIVIIFALLVIFSFFPFPGKYRLYVVYSGSMAPTIKTGSLIVIRERPDYQVGEIITFRPLDARQRNEAVTHRIIRIVEEKGGKLIFTKGDANDTEDKSPIPIANIVGKFTFKIPYLGYPIGFAKTMPGLVFLIIIPGTIIVYSETQNIIKEIKKKKIKRRKNAKNNK